MSGVEDAELRRLIAALDRGEADTATLREAARALSARSAERDAAAREAREGQERLRLAVEAAGIGVFEWDLQFRRATWNAHRARICGLDPSVLEGTQAEFGACVHPDDQEEVGLQLTAAMAGRREYDHEHRVVWPDGTVRWVRGRGRFRYDDRGDPVRMTGVLIDTTARHEAEAAAVAAAAAAAGGQYLRTVMDQAPLGACVVDGRRLTVKWVTERFLRQSGSALAPADVVGEPCGELIPNFEAEGVRSLFERVAATGEPFAHDEYEFHGHATTRGVTYWRWSLTPLPPADPGGPHDLLIQTLDVTEYVRARKRAETDAARAGAEAARAGAEAEQAEATAERAAADTGALRRLHQSTADALALLDTLLAHAPVGIALVDRDYRIRRVNREMVAITGTTPVDQVGRTVAEVLPDVWPALAPLYARVLRGETVLDVEGSGTSPAHPGDVRHWRASLYPVRTGPPGPDGLGTETMIGVIVADETDRRRVAAAARRAQELLRAFADNTPDPVFVKDLSGRVLMANAANVRVTGKPHDQIVGHTTEEVFDDPAVARAMRANDRRVLESGRAAVVEELVHTPDGPRTYMVSKAPYRDAAGQVAGLVGVARDITDRKRMEEDLRRARDAAEAANRAKDVFLSTLSHELRTPLNAVLGWAQLLKMMPAPPLGGSAATDAADAASPASPAPLPEADTIAEAADGIVHSAQSLTRLVDDLLDIGRVVAGKMRVESDPVDLWAVLDRSAAAVRFAAVEKRVALEVVRDAVAADTRAGGAAAAGDVAAAPPRPVVAGDAWRLEQVFANLLGNAVKFTPAGGRVTVRLDRDDHRARVVVRDTGHGIPAGFLSHVFDRFAQADDPPYGGDRPDRPRGLGLGLSIVKHLVELHGGSVTAHSDGPGTGATFTVDLPLSGGPTAPAAEPPAVREVPAIREPLPPVVAPDAVAGTAAAAAEAASPPLAGARAVVVDDAPANRATVAELLRRCGAEVTECASAAEGLAAVRAARPDVLVSDLALPGADGYELIRQIRALPADEGGAVPAVALTGRAGGEDWLDAVGGGFHAHLAKPADAAALVRIVAALVARAREPR